MSNSIIKNGVYRKNKSQYVVVNGVYRKVKSDYEVVNGVYRKTFSGAKPVKIAENVTSLSMDVSQYGGDASNYILDFPYSQYTYTINSGYFNGLGLEVLKNKNGNTLNVNLRWFWRTGETIGDNRYPFDVWFVPSPRLLGSSPQSISGLSTSAENYLCEIESIPLIDPGYSFCDAWIRATKTIDSNTITAFSKIQTGDWGFHYNNDFPHKIYYIG